MVKVREERFQAPEILFQPHLAGSEVKGLPMSIAACVNAADIDTRTVLWRHIVLSGGTTCLIGLKERLTSELNGLLQSRTPV